MLAIRFHVNKETAVSNLFLTLTMIELFFYNHTLYIRRIFHTDRIHHTIRRVFRAFMIFIR